MSALPYIPVGCDVTNMSDDTFAILSAKELIAVNQDPLGIQGDLIYQLGPIQIWAGPLSTGERAFVLFNRHIPSQYNEEITINFADLGFPRNTVATVRFFHRMF
jgi:alpha-galactosidase